MVSGDSIGSLSALSSGNHHVIIRITDNAGQWYKICYQVYRLSFLGYIV
jgi:hypothetical protein